MVNLDLDCQVNECNGSAVMKSNIAGRCGFELWKRKSKILKLGIVGINMWLWATPQFVAMNTVLAIRLKNGLLTMIGG